MPAKRSSSCRLRKVACPDCGYTVRMARSWLSVGLPGCPCGCKLEPTDMADRAYCGLIGQDDCKATDWTLICRENGWEDAIARKGAAALAYQSKLAERGGILGGRAGAAHCSYAGCGRWVADGAQACSAGHAQDGAVLEACPF